MVHARPMIPPMADSTLDPIAAASIRALLRPPQRTERLWPTLAAAGFAAFSAIALAAAMILAPPIWGSAPAAKASPIGVIP